VIANNSKNISKTNNYLSPQIFVFKKNNTTTYGVTNPGAGLGQDKNRWVKSIY
jgi:hypothetical protein